MSELLDRVKRPSPRPPEPPRGSLRFRLRRLTAPLRVLPDFLIIGTQRAGTTSLFEYLGQHPCLMPSSTKEVWYFSARYGRGLAWYRSHFPLRLRKSLQSRLGAGRVLTYEASPNYLFHPLAAARAARVLPGAKLIVLLRNPVDRAFSHYQHRVRQGGETLSFEEAIAREAERLAPDIEALRRDPLYECRDYFRFSYVSRGFYFDQLQEWGRHFPRDQIFIEKSEDFFKDPGGAYRRILDFLELPPWEPGDYRNYSYAVGIREEADSMRPDTRELLRRRFAPHNERLFEFLGRRFSWDDS